MQKEVKGVNVYEVDLKEDTYYLDGKAKAQKKGFEGGGKQVALPHLSFPKTPIHTVQFSEGRENIPFDKLKAQLSAEEIEGATPKGSALKLDPHHHFPNEVIKYSAETGKHFTIKNRDGSYVNLFQVEGGYLKSEGIFEWIVDAKGHLTHKLFIENGKITGHPNQKHSKK
jgi:hypothetical protein